MTNPTACVDCLRRAWLLALLGPYIERLDSSDSVRQVPSLLCLSNDDLAKAAAPKVAAQIIARVEALSLAQMGLELTAANCWSTCRHDPLYPVALRDGAEVAPWALFGRGDRSLLEELRPNRAATVVGARRATSKAALWNEGVDLIVGYRQLHAIVSPKRGTFGITPNDAEGRRAHRDAENRLGRIQLALGQQVIRELDKAAGISR